jgi:hypothetical protein
VTHKTKRPPGRTIPEGRDGGPNSPAILSPWEYRGQATVSPVPRPVQAVSSAEAPSDQPSDRMFGKQELADYLRISVRTLDRLDARKLLPAPDLVVGRSPRWLPDSIAVWLANKPRLSGRGVL